VKVLVSGSHGLVGAALVNQLAGEGHDVVRLVRSDSTDRLLGGTVTWTPTEGSVDRDAMRDASPFDAVVHLAGAGIGDRRWTPQRQREIRDSRVASTRLLVNELRLLDHLPSVLVSASAVGYYGDRGDERLHEDSGPGTGFLAEVCQAWEAEASTIADSVRVVTLRSGIVLTPRGGALAKQLPLFRVGLGGRLGSGRQYTSWITLRDELSVIRRSLEDERVAGPVNATAPLPVTNAVLSAALGRALRRPAALPVPRAVLELAFGRAMTDDMLLASQRAEPGRLLALGHVFADPDIDLALAAMLAPGV
jgi:uncharacterized protein